MTHMVVVASDKGGVAKTLCSLLAGGLAAQYGWRVKFVNLDSQGRVDRCFPGQCSSMTHVPKASELRTIHSLKLAPSVFGQLR